MVEQQGRCANPGGRGVPLSLVRRLHWRTPRSGFAVLVKRGALLEQYLLVLVDNENDDARLLPMNGGGGVAGADGEMVYS